MQLITRSRARIALLSAGLCTLGTTAHAQRAGGAGGPYRPVTVWLGGGPSTPISDFKETAKSGFSAAGALQYRPDGKPLGVRGELQYHKMDVSPEFLAEAGAPVGVTGTWSVLYGGASAVLESMDRNAGFGWFLVAGGGSYRVEPSINDGGVTQSTAETAFGFNGGGGVRFRMGPVGLFVEGRYHTVTIQDSKVTLLPVSVGLVF